MGGLLSPLSVLAVQLKPWPQGGRAGQGRTSFFALITSKKRPSGRAKFGGSAFRRDRFDYKSSALMPGSQGLSFCMSRDKYKLCKAHQSPVGPHPHWLCLRQWQVRAGYEGKGSGKPADARRMPVRSAEGAGRISGGGWTTGKGWSRTGCLPSLGPGGQWGGMYSLQWSPWLAPASPPSAHLQPACFSVGLATLSGASDSTME